MRAPKPTPPPGPRRPRRTFVEPRPPTTPTLRFSRPTTVVLTAPTMPGSKLTDRLTRR